MAVASGEADAVTTLIEVGASVSRVDEVSRVA
jgi:hypothetical protein